MSSESEQCDGDAGDGRSAGTLHISRGRDTLVVMRIFLTGLYLNSSCPEFELLYFCV